MLLRTSLASSRTLLAPAATLSSSSRPRPISPHVTIYKFPLSALSSIAHRVTGVALSAGNNPTPCEISLNYQLAFISVGALGAAGVSVAHVAHALHDIGPLAVIPIKAAVGFPLVYHASAGVRHLVSSVGSWGF